MAYKSPLFAQAGGSILAYKDENGKFIRINDNNIPDIVDLTLPAYQLPAQAFSPTSGTVNYGGGNITRGEGKFTSQYGTLEEGKIYIGSLEKFNGAKNSYTSLPFVFQNGKLRILKGFTDLDARQMGNRSNSTQFRPMLDKITNWLKDNPDIEVIPIHPDLIGSYSTDQTMQKGTKHSVWDISTPYDPKNPTPSTATNEYQSLNETGTNLVKSVNAAGGNLITNLAKTNADITAVDQTVKKAKVTAPTTGNYSQQLTTSYNALNPAQKSYVGGIADFSNLVSAETGKGLNEDMAIGNVIMKLNKTQVPKQVQSSYQPQVPAQGAPPNTDGSGIVNNPDVNNPVVNDPVVNNNNYTDNSNTNFNSLLMDLIKQDPFLSEQFKDPAKLALFQGMPAALQDTYIQILKRLQITIDAGNIINPDIDLSPEKVAEFLQTATSELDLYYQEQIGFYKQDLDISLRRMQENFSKGISRGEDTFKEGLLNQAENEAQSGTAFSSGRQDRVSKTITAGQQGVDDLVTQSARSAQDFGIGAERALGSANMPNIGGFNTYNVTDQGFAQSGNRNLFTPQGNLLGSIPKQRIVDISNRQGQLINAEKDQRVLDFSTL